MASRGRPSGEVTRGRLIVPSRIPSTHPLHEPRALTAAERQFFRESAKAAREAKAAALRGEGPSPLHDVNVPKLDPLVLMPQREFGGLAALSLFSGGGGLDIGFERAGVTHAGAFEILEDAAATLTKARPDWDVHGGSAGDVRHVDWRPWRDQVDILHGGPPCQPFSHAGRGRGSLDPRDMWPEFVRAVETVRPAAFVGENVPALAGKRFSAYVQQTIVEPLSSRYEINQVVLHAHHYGTPQVRRRVFFVGFRRRRDAKRWLQPKPRFGRPGGKEPELPPCMGVREALGLPDTGFDDLSPTIRSTLNGPRNTTSILNSVSAKHRFEALQIWPNGVAANRDAARAFVSPTGHFRLSVQDVAIIQGFPEDWPFVGATYMILGQIGNAVPPPLAYAVASSVVDALSAR